MISTVSIAVLLALQLAPESAKSVNPAEVSRYISQLGDSDYRTRTTATQALDDLGTAVLPALEKASETLTDPEALHRAKDLAARITHRAENARLIGATRVTLNLNDVTPAEAFAALEKQTNYRFALPATWPTSTKPIRVKTSPSAPLWEVLHELCEATGLEPITATASAPVQYSSQLEQVRNDAMRNQLQAQIQAMRVMVDTQNKKKAILEQLQAQLEERQKVAKDDEKAKLDAEIAKTKVEIAQSTVAIATHQAQIVALERGLHGGKSGNTPVPEGTIALRVKTPLSLPSTSTGAVRLSVAMFPEPALKTVASNRVPFLLTISTEPKLKWERTTDVFVSKATTDNGVSLACEMSRSPMLDAMRVQQFGGGQVVIINGNANVIPQPSNTVTTNFQPSANQGLAMLMLPASADKIAKLATVEGVIRGQVRSPVEDVLTIKELVSGKQVTETGHNNTSVQATLTPIEGDPTRYTMAVTLNYDPTQVRPEIAGATPVSGGRGGFTASRTSIGSSSYGLSLYDADGKPMTFTASRTMSRHMNTGGNQQVTMQMTFNVQATETTSPKKLVFRGTYAKAVEVPFTLKNVPVVMGSGPVEE